MYKYENSNTSWRQDSIEAYLDPMEYVFWKGKGKKLPYIVNSGAKMAPFALLWLFVDGSIILSMVGAFLSDAGAPSGMLMFLVPFFAVHLMPVWIWLGSMIKGAKKWENSAYAITDRQIIIKDASSGLMVKCYKYDTIISVKLHKGFVDKMLGVADLQFRLVDGSNVNILDISEAEAVYPKVKQRIEETPCVREMHPNNVAGDSDTHICKDYQADYNPYEN